MQMSHILLNATFGLASFTLNTFDETAQGNFRGAIADAALKTYHTMVTTTLGPARAGSVLVDASMLFLSSSADIVDRFTSDLQVSMSRLITQGLERPVHLEQVSACGCSRTPFIQSA